MPKRFAFPIIVIVIVLAVYSAYWIYASGQIANYVDQWEAEQEAAGFTIEHTPIRVGGYPYRFSVAAETLRVEAPRSEGGWVLELTSFEANALPYDFSHWIIALGEDVVFTQGDDGLALSMDDARFSVSSADGVTQRIGAELTGVTLTGIGDKTPPISTFESLLLSAATNDADQMAVRLQLDDAELAESQFDPVLTGAFGTDLGRLQADFVISSWRALAESANVIAWRQADGDLNLREFHIDWGRLDIDAEGEIGLDNDLRPAGRLSLNVIDPEALVDAIIDSGALTGDQANAIRFLAQSAPRSDEGTAIPLLFRNGGLFFGPVRLADVPPIVD